jgi:hypothetical protein
MLIDNLNVSGVLLPADQLYNTSPHGVFDEFGPVFVPPCVFVDRFQQIFGQGYRCLDFHTTKIPQKEYFVNKSFINIIEPTAEISSGCKPSAGVIY